MVREVAVIGLGRFGTAVALALAEAGCSVVGIDRDRELVQDVADQLADVVQADATNEAALQQIGITDFDVVVVAIGADFESNLLITASLKQLGVRHVIAKALSRRQAAILHKIGADQVVLPEHESGKRLANRLIAPDVPDALQSQTGVPAAEIALPDAWIGQTLAQLDLPRQHSVLVVAIRRGNNLLVTPGANESFEPGDRVVLVGSAGHLRMLSRQLRHRYV